MRRYQEILILLLFLYQQSIYGQQLDMNLPLEIMDGFPEFGTFDYEEDKELRNESKARIEKVKRGLRLSAGYNLGIGAGLLIMPSKVTHWKREISSRQRARIWERPGQKNRFGIKMP